MPKQTTKTFSVRAAALETGYTAKHIRDLLWENRIPGASKVDGVWIIPAACVEDLRKRKQGADRD